MSELFGYTNDGKRVDKITLRDESGDSVALISYGASIQSIVIDNTDICLGYDTVVGYENNDGCLGGLIGRCANRIGNASFIIDGKEIKVTPNKGTYHIHGGNVGFHKKVWSYKEDDNSVTFTLVSEDGDEGYPGNCTAKVEYTFESGCLRLDYDGVSDKKTVINLTNHCYFNLNGADSNTTVHNHEMKISADMVAFSDENSVPTGELVDVTGTPFDFRTAKAVGKDIDDSYPLLSSKRGYDHNFLVKSDGLFKHCATLENGKLEMQVWTDMDDIIVYTANYLNGQMGKKNISYQPRYGICFETQYMTNAVNLDGFRKPVFDAGEHFRQHTEFRFIRK